MNALRKMKIDDKGIPIGDWLFKVLWGLVTFFMLDIYNQNKQDRKDQSMINKEIIGTIQQIQQINTATAKDNGYILKEIAEIKQEIRDIKKDYRLKEGR